jgi:hypothetical protein
VAVAVAGLSSSGSVLAAPGTTKDGGATTIGSLDGFENPPNADKNGSGYVNPCLGREGFEAHVSKPTGLVKSDVDKISVAFDGNVIKFESTSAPGGSVGISIAIDPTFEVEYVEWRTACAPAEDSLLSAYEDGTERRYWIKRPTQGSVVPDLVAQVTANLAAPDVFWPNVDPEFGWVYVTIDNDVRIAPMANVRREARVGNLVGSVSAWVEASPSQIVFEPGEPGSPGMSCSYESATAPYAIEFASSCFYRYANSSSIGTVVADAFVTRTTVSWEIASSGPLTYSDPESWREETIQVAAVQAIEIAT